VAGGGDAAAHTCFLRRALEIADFDGLPIAELERVLGSVAQALRPVADLQRPLLAERHRPGLLKRLAERVGTALPAGGHLAGDVLARRVEPLDLGERGGGDGQREGDAEKEGAPHGAILRPPPAFCERRHRGLACVGIAVRWRAVLVVSKVHRPQPCDRKRHT